MAAVHTLRRVFDEYSTGLQLPCWRPLWMPSSREPSPTVARVVWSHHRLHHLGAAERRRRRSRIRRRASSRSRVESSVRHPAPLGSGSGVLEPFGTGGMESEYRAVTVPVRSVVLPWLAVPPVAALALDRFRLLRPVAFSGENVGARSKSGSRGLPPRPACGCRVRTPGRDDSRRGRRGRAWLRNRWRPAEGLASDIRCVGSAPRAERLRDPLSSPRRTIRSNRDLLPWDSAETSAGLRRRARGAPRPATSVGMRRAWRRSACPWVDLPAHLALRSSENCQQSDVRQTGAGSAYSSSRVNLHTASGSSFAPSAYRASRRTGSIFAANSARAASRRCSKPALPNGCGDLFSVADQARC